MYLNSSMKLLNESELEQWIYQINQSKYCVKRFEIFPLSLIDFDWQNELQRLATIFRDEDRYDITFHNVRMLIANVRCIRRFEQPLVGLYVNDNINVHPGGSRIMVANYLGISSIPLDLIIERDNTQFDHLQYKIIDSRDEFLKPFQNINSEMQILFNNDQSYGSEYSYQPVYSNQFHWNGCEPINDFVNRTRNTKCDSVMDYYLL